MRVRHLMVGIASLGGLLFGYETGVTAGALEHAKSSWLSTATLIGAMIGTLAAGRLADLVGRRDVIMATGALFTLGAFVSAIAPSELVNLIGGLVVGIGVGAISVAAPLYIAEIAPIARRGAMICIFQLMIRSASCWHTSALRCSQTTPTGDSFWAPARSWD